MEEGSPMIAPGQSLLYTFTPINQPARAGITAMQWRGRTWRAVRIQENLGS
jgi:hypothetical protein